MKNEKLKPGRPGTGGWAGPVNFWPRKKKLDQYFQPGPEPVTWALAERGHKYMVPRCVIASARRAGARRAFGGIEGWEGYRGLTGEGLATASGNAMLAMHACHACIHEWPLPDAAL